MSRLDLLAKFGLDTTGWQKGITEVQGGTNKFNAALSGIGSKVAGAFAVGAVTAFATKTIKSAMDTADKLTDMARVAGVSTDSLQALARAATETGGDLAPVEKALMSLKQKAGDAINGNTAIANSFKHFGIEIEDLRNKAPEQILDKIMQQLNASGNSASEFARATDILGKSVEGLDEIFQKIADNGGLDSWIKKLKESGKIIDAQALEELADLKDQLTKMGADIEINKTRVTGNMVLAWRNIAPEKLGGFTDEERSRRDPIFSKNWEEYEKRKAAERAAKQELVNRENLLLALDAEEQAQQKAKRKATLEGELNELINDRLLLMSKYNKIVEEQGEHNSEALQYNLEALKLMPQIAALQQKVLEQKEKQNKLDEENRKKELLQLEEQQRLQAEKQNKLDDIQSGRGLTRDREDVDQFQRIGLFANAPRETVDVRAYWQRTIAIQEQMRHYLGEIADDGVGGYND